MAASVMWIVQNLRTNEVREVNADTAFSACLKLGWRLSDCVVNRA